MQKQAEVAAVAGGTEAAPAGRVALEVQFGRILDRQHMPPGRAPRGQPPRMHQHRVGADRAAVGKPPKPQRLVALVGQRMQA